MRILFLSALFNYYDCKGELIIKYFYNSNNLKCLINNPIYFANFSEPTCIDWMLTTWPSFFQHSQGYEITPWYIHLFTITGFRWVFKNLKEIKTWQIENEKINQHISEVLNNQTYIDSLLMNWPSFFQYGEAF